MSLERRREIYAIAQRYDLIIIEDDPYYYLYFGAAARPPSYFALEPRVLPEVGRVLRFDSLSKILSSGIRIGFMCAPEAVMNAVDVHVRLPFSLLPWL